MNTSLPARANEALIDELHERWLKDRNSVDSEWGAFFEGFELGLIRLKKLEAAEAIASVGSPLQARVDAMVEAFRAIGHTAAHLDPISEQSPEHAQLDPAAFGLLETDMNEVVSCRHFQGGRAMPLRELVQSLRQIFCDTVGIEFTHI